MKVSYEWLQEYVKTSLTAEELADKFRMTSSEVEETVDWQKRLEGIVVGQVTKLVQHPNADRLRVASVSLGNEDRTIVCGAPNIAEGQHVLVALPGTTLHPVKGEPFTLQEVKLRGVQSEGMICALEEIGIPLPSEGIFVFEEPVKIGTPAAEALNFADTVLDLEITPNRPDLLSHFGLAREVSAFDKRRLSEPSITSLEGPKPLPKVLDITVDHTHGCLRYSALCLTNVAAVSSPWWLQSRLLKVGIRPINAIVDVTNYVMLELGQPLHAFDLAELPKNKRGTHPIIIREPEGEEKLLLLDGTTRKLAKGDVLICNADRTPIALGGIMGGEHSGIKAETKEIVLESATFSGSHIRRTSRRLGLRSEASTRFEKGIDPEMTITALKRAAYLLEEIAGGKVSSQIADYYPHARSVRPRIHLSLDHVQEILGVHISAPEAKAIQQKLGFQVPLVTKSSIEVVPPSWRGDVRLAEDVIEELIRIWGFERLPATLPSGQIKAPFPNQAFNRRNLARKSLAESGFFECIHIPFVAEQQIKRAGIDSKVALKLPNPLSQESEYLSPSHLVQLLNNLGTVNLDRESCALFEAGRIFLAPSQEVERLSLVIRGRNNPEKLYRELKGALESIAEVLQLGPVTYQETTTTPYYIPGSELTVILQNKEVGAIGMIKPEIVEGFKIRRGRFLMFAEIDMQALLSLPEEPHFFAPLPVFPSIERDLTLILPRTIRVRTVEEFINKQTQGSPILLSWNIVDLYEGKPLNADQKSITLHFVYNGQTRTLEENEVSTHQEALIKKATTELQAIINA